MTQKEQFKYHYEKALEHLLALEDMTDYKIKYISEIVDKLFENYETFTGGKYKPTDD